MNKLFLTLFALFFSLATFAQDWELPEDYSIQSAQDCEDFEEDFMESIDYLLNTNLDEDEEYRKEVSKFFLLWVSKTDYFTITIDAKVVNFTELNPDLLVVFMAGWSAAAMDDEDLDAFEGNVAGLEAVAEFYKNNKRYLAKDKKLMKIVSTARKGKLEDYVEKTWTPVEEEDDDEADEEDDDDDDDEEDYDEEEEEEEDEE